MSSDSAIHAIAGAAGGMVSMAVTYPLVNLSTRAQVETKQHGDQSTLATIRRIVKAEGIAGLFDGLESSIVGIAVTNGVYYLFFEEARAVILRRKASVSQASRTLSTLESILASFVAGCATAIISNPIWTINTQQMVQASLDEPDNQASVQMKRDPKTGEMKVVKKLSVLQTVRKMYKRDGLAAFFRGLGPALILTINPIIAYTSFEQIQNLIIARRGAQRLPTGTQGITSKPVVLPLTDLDNFLLGAFCKLLATGSLYPYLVVKSRLQAGGTVARRYRNSFHGLATIFQEEGLGALYNGIGSKLAQSMLTAAFLFASKERIYLATKAAIRTTVAR